MDTRCGTAGKIRKGWSSNLDIVREARAFRVRFQFKAAIYKIIYRAEVHILRKQC